MVRMFAQSEIIDNVIYVDLSWPRVGPIYALKRLSEWTLLKVYIYYTVYRQLPFISILLYFVLWFNLQKSPLLKVICFISQTLVYHSAAWISQLVFTECVLEKLCSKMLNEALAESHEWKLFYDSATSTISANVCVYILPLFYCNCYWFYIPSY